MITTTLEPPPRQKRKGCCAGGCFTLLILLLVLVVAFAGGGFWAAHKFRDRYFAAEPILIQSNTTTPSAEEVAPIRERWDALEQAADAHEKKAVEFTADDINTLIASKKNLRGKVSVTIENNLAHVRVSIPLRKISKMVDGRFLNGECYVQASSDKNPVNAKMTGIMLNGSSVSDDVLDWQVYGTRSLRSYIVEYANAWQIETFAIENNVVKLTTKGGSE